MIMTNLQIIISNLSYEMARYYITLRLCEIAVCVALLIFLSCFFKKKGEFVKKEWGPVIFISFIADGVILVALIISLIGWLIAPVAATITCLCEAM